MRGVGAGVVELRKAQVRAKGLLSRKGVQKQVVQRGRVRCGKADETVEAAEEAQTRSSRTRGKEPTVSLNLLPRATGSHGRDLSWSVTHSICILVVGRV